MGELRDDEVAGLRVIVAPGRSQRPGAFAAPGERPVRQTPDDCPFCAGHEDRTPPQVLVLPEAAPWQVRVVPNLFPAIGKDDGAQDVVVHAPQHAVSLAELDTAQIGLIVEAWRQRTDRRREEGWRYLFPFVNEGAGSGASLDHSHSQLVAFAELPALIARRLARFDAACPVCATMPETSSDRLVTGDDQVRLWAPHASSAPYHLRGAPIGHAAEALADPAQLARLLQSVARAYVGALGPVPWNAWVYTAPLDGSSSLHWHVEAFPRVSSLAALELGAGLPVCQVAPEAAASELRAAL